MKPSKGYPNATDLLGMLLGVRVNAGASGSLDSSPSGLCGPEGCACSLPYSCFPCYASAFLSNNHLLAVAIVFIPWQPYNDT